MDSKYNIEEISEYYDIYSDGKVMSKRTNRLMKPSRGNLNQLFYCLYIGRPIHVTVARLIALKFIPNPKGLTNVGYIDGNRFNYKADNLIWQTRKQILRGAQKKKHWAELDVETVEYVSMLSNDARIKPVCVEGKNFSSVKEACLSLNISRRKFNRLWGKLGVEVIID
jgi:hypothetical protein